MKHGSTFFLKTVVILIGLAALLVCILALPGAISLELTGDFDYGFVMLGMYISAVPFFIALYQALKLLHYIDKNQTFSRRSVAALKRIKYCALIVGGLYTAGLPYLFYLADTDDAPGVFALGLVTAGASFVVATFVAVLQRLLQNAVDIKSENDLTV